jgi:hypothetical protein
MLNPLSKLKMSVKSKHLERMYKAFILPHLEYGGIIYDSANQSLLAKLEQVQYRAALIVSGCIKGTNNQKVLKCLDWMKLEKRRDEKKLVLMFDVTHSNTPSYVQEAFNKYRNLHANRRLRNHRNFLIPTNASTLRRKSTVCSSIKLWDCLQMFPATPSNIAFVSFTMDKTMSLLLQNLNLIGKKKLF